MLEGLTSEPALALEVTHLFDLFEPLPVSFFTVLNANHAIAELAFPALPFLLEYSSKFVPTNDHLALRFTASGVGTDTSGRLSHLYEVVVFQISMQTVGHTILTVKNRLS